jgi:hypothetical protein
LLLAAVMATTAFSVSAAAYSMQAQTFAATSSMSNFMVRASYGTNTFTDVASKEWYASSVKKAFELGIMNGKGAGIFEPTGNIRVSEAIKMACVVHNIYNGSTTVFTQDAQPWYQPYVDYAKANGILGNVAIGDYNAYISRQVMSYYFSRALPESELAAINTVEMLPDVDQAKNVGSAIFRLYRAGVLTGNDSYGTFEPDSAITRAQAAAIITRLVVPTERKYYVLKTVSLTPEKQALIDTRRTWFNTTQKLRDSCDTVFLGDAATAYFYDNGLILLEEYAEYDPNTDAYVKGSYNSEFYYMDGEVYCIKMTDPGTGGTAGALYFHNGELLCWKDGSGIDHYNGYRWDEMQSYYAHAKAQCDIAATHR